MAREILMMVEDLDIIWKTLLCQILHNFTIINCHNAGSLVWPSLLSLSLLLYSFVLIYAYAPRVIIPSFQHMSGLQETWGCSFILCVILLYIIYYDLKTIVSMMNGILEIQHNKYYRQLMAWDSSKKDWLRRYRK